MDSIGNIFSTKKDSSHFGTQVDSAMIIEDAKKVFIDFFGIENAKHVKPLFLKNRTLTVSCSSGVVAQEIRLNQVKIVEKLNKVIGEEKVDRIRYLM